MKYRISDNAYDKFSLCYSPGEWYPYLADICAGAADGAYIHRHVSHLFDFSDLPVLFLSVVLVLYQAGL